MSAGEPARTSSNMLTARGRGASEPLLSENAKKLLLAAVLVGAAVVVYFSFGRSDENPLPDRLPFVCVATGERLELSRSQFNSIPARHPETGMATLLPVEEREGRWYVGRRYAGSLAQELKDVNKFVDARTLEVRSAP